MDEGGSGTTKTETTAEAGRFRFNSDAQALAHFDTDHKRVLLFGGVGSGKTATHALWVIDRSTFDTGQLHGLFTNTEKQLINGVIPEIRKWCAMAGVEIEYDRKPPKSWFAKWAREGTEIPLLNRYRGILTASTGFHALCGTLFNQSYTQYQTIQFGSLRIEEAPNVSLQAITFMIERLRCGSGKDVCRKRHRHQAYLIGNPPLGSHPWLYDWLDQLEDSAKVHAPEDFGELDHRSWPLLKQGIGDTILIQSKTSDNAENLNDGYEEGLAAGYDKDTARRRLEGEIVRESSGVAYSEFSNENVREIAYDPNRPLYLCLDFNLEPRVAVLAHPLTLEEVPPAHRKPGQQYIGAFGEFFHLGGMSDRQFAESIVRGFRGEGGNYLDDDRGLPPNWKGLRAHNGHVVAFGDAVGQQRSVHSDNLESSWQIVDAVLRQLRNAKGEQIYARNVPEFNPAPRARIHSVNAMLENALGVRRLFIAPRCRELIKDFNQCVWDHTGMDLRKWGARASGGTEWHRTHESDALGYMIHRLFPLGNETDSPSGFPVTVSRPNRKPPRV